MSSMFTMRLSDEDELEFEKAKIDLKLKSKADVVRHLLSIANSNNKTSSSINDLEDIKEIKKNCFVTVELLKQFYGEMSYKEYVPDARKSDRVKHFLNDLYNPEDNFMK